MKIIDIPYAPHKYQQEIHDDKHRFKLLVCGRRFGKTTLTVNELIIHALQKPGSLNWYVAPTYKQAKQIAWKMLLYFLPKELITHKDEQDLTVTFLTTGGKESTISLRGADNEDSLRGVGLNFVILDEYREIKSNVWPEIIRPMLIDTKGEAIIISTAAINHLKDLYDYANTEDGIRDDWKTWRFKSSDNPHLPPEELLRTRREYESQGRLNEYLQEFEAEWKSATGAVYSNFSYEHHVLRPDKYPKFTDTSHIYFRSIDFGVDNPTAVLFIAVDYDDNVYVFDEWYKRGQSIDQIAQGCKKHPFRFQTTYYDTSGAIYEIELGRRGIYLTPAPKGKGSVLAGIQVVLSKLAISPISKKPKLFILDRCKNLLDEITHYEWKERRAEDLDPQDQPVKFNDHAVDALRYFIATYFAPKKRKEEKRREETYSESANLGSIYA